MEASRCRLEKHANLLMKMLSCTNHKCPNYMQSLLSDRYQAKKQILVRSRIVSRPPLVRSLCKRQKACFYFTGLAAHLLHNAWKHVSEGCKRRRVGSSHLFFCMTAASPVHDSSQTVSMKKIRTSIWLLCTCAVCVCCAVLSFRTFVYTAKVLNRFL